MSEGISIRRISATVASVGVLVGAAFTIDSRYVHADDFKAQSVALRQEIIDLRIARLQDEIFRLELIPEKKRTDADKALLDRYKSQVREIDARRAQRDR